MTGSTRKRFDGASGMNIKPVRTKADHRAALKDLESMIGRTNRIYEVLNRKRPLTLKMIWRLHQGLGIPAECLIKPSDERQAA